ATTTWLRRASSAPEVGFCRGGGVVGTSSSVTLQVARIGVPSGRNIVYCACTCLTMATKLVNVPQPNTTHGGDGVFVLSVSRMGVTQSSSVWTSAATV